MKLSHSVKAVLASLLVAASLPSAAAPTLIGDTISFLRAYPDRTTQYGNAIPDTTVMAGSADVVGWSIGLFLNLATFDPEANSILLNINSLTSLDNDNSGQFDGFIVSGIDADLIAASVLSNGTGYQVDLGIDSLHSLSIGLNGSNVPPGSILIGLQLRDTAVPPVTGVPEPTSAALAAAALGMLALRKTRRAHDEERDRSDRQC